MTGGQVGVIGGGMAGLACATWLAHRGISATVFDKGRGPGGRMATRRADAHGKDLRFDHGAQYFTARDPEFAAVCAAWRDAGVIAPWPAAGAGAMVGTPGMNAPVKHMAGALDVRWGARVDSIRHDGSGWLVQTGGEEFAFAQLVVAIPAEQAAILLADVAPQFAAQAASVVSAPCWAVMAAFDGRLPIMDDALKPGDGAIAWAARDGAKPGRDGTESWVIHASPEYSREILEDTPEDAAARILAKFFVSAGIAPSEPTHLAAHRWRYAMVDRVSGDHARWDQRLGLGVCGDWLSGPRVENAFLSGRALAERMDL